MTDTIKVPDIGDFKDVPIIEVYVKPGQTIAAEETLITLESDKAAMDVPAPSAGVIGEVRVKVGDRVSGARSSRPSSVRIQGRQHRRHPRLPSQCLPRLQRAICTPRCL